MTGEFIGQAILWLIAAVIVIAIVYWVMHWLYRRSTKEVAFVRTGLLGEKVVIDGGAFVWPIVHDITPVNMNTLPLAVERTREQALITKDRMRVDVEAEFYVRVRSDKSSVSKAAATLGRRTLETERLNGLLSGKFESALRAVAAEMSMGEMHENRGAYVARVKEQAQEDLSLSEGKLTGHMYLGLPPTVARTISLDVVQAFKEQLPDAHLTIIESLTVNLEEQIHLDRVNMGLLYNPSSSPTLETQLLAEEQLHLICGVDSPYAQGRSRIALKDLADIPLIMPSLSNSFRMLVEKEMQKLNLKPQIEFEINSVGVIIQLLAKGMGAAILSRSVLEFIPQSGLLTAIPIEQPALVNRLYLAYSSKRLPTKLQVKVRQILIDICQRHFPGRDD